MLYQDVKVWYIECGAHLPNGYFTRKHIMPVDKVNEFRFKHHNTGVYTTAYMYDDMDQNNANLIGDFYLDLDAGHDEDSFGKVKEDALSCISYLRFVYGIPEQYMRIYFSGNKGVHITIPHQVLDIEPHPKLNAVFRSMAEEIAKNTKHHTVDLKIYDNKRLFRMANSKHNKTGLYKIQLSHSELKSMVLADIVRMAKIPRIIKQESEPKPIRQANAQYKIHLKKLEAQILKRNAPSKFEGKPLDFTPPCINKLLNETVQEGQRNCTVAVLTSFFRQQGLDIEEAAERLADWNDRHCSPPMKQSEIDATLHSVYSREYTYGCSSAKILSACDIDNCPMGKGKRNGGNGNGFSI